MDPNLPTFVLALVPDPVAEENFEREDIVLRVAPEWERGMTWIRWCISRHDRCI